MARINKQEACVCPIYTGIYQRHKGYDNEVDYYTAYILNTQDYYPFGNIMPGRNNSTGEYRFGFNGQAKDDEITRVTGANYTAEFWEYDSREGRRWNTDLVVKEWEIPYACFVNNPICLIDISGSDTGDVVVAYGGVDLSNNGDQGTVAPNIVNKINENFKTEGGAAKSFASEFNFSAPLSKENLDIATEDAYAFIMSNYNKDAQTNDIKGGRFIIYGFSYGRRSRNSFI